MNPSQSEPDLVGRIAEAFLARYRKGERPSLTEYIKKYPELASQIRELFPALVVMEELGSVEGPREEAAARTLDKNKVPEQLGDYRILREVGRGGMGIVYEAVQLSLGRHVALKVLLLHGHLSPIHLERFHREARAAARLHHTNIVPVHGVGEHEGVHYYAMQFIQGQALDDVLKEVKRLRGKSDPPFGTGDDDGGDRSQSLAQALVSGIFESAEGLESESEKPIGDGKSKPVDCGDSPANPQSAICRPQASDSESLFQKPGAARFQRAGAGENQQIGTLKTCRHNTSGTDSNPCLPSTASGTELTSQPYSQYFRSVAQMGMQVARGLDYAHKQGILHRDIKPSNLLLDAKGTVWIADFGLAKAEGTDELTHTGDIVGTLRYMAPERFHGWSDPRSDVYCLGITLYELLTLRPAFADSCRPRLIERILHDEPPRPRRLDRTIPRDLETIVLKAINKDPVGRYQTAVELADDLQGFLSGLPIRARRTGAWERTVKWVQRRPAIAALAAAVLLALVCGIVATTWQARRATQAEAEALSEADRNRRLLYSADVHLASQAWQSEEGTATQCNELLLAHVPGPGQADLREFCWRYQWRLLHSDSVVRLPSVPIAAAVAAGDRVVTLDGAGKVNAWLIDDPSKREESTLAGGEVLGVTLARNGEVAAVIDRDGSPKVFDVRTGVQKVQIHAPSALVNLKLSADGRFLAGVGRDKHARVWDTASGKELYDFLMIDPTASQFDLSFDGKQLLASCTAEGERVVLYRAGEEKPLVLNKPEGGFNRFQGALSPNGKVAAVATAGNLIELHDTTTGKSGRWLRTRSIAERVTFSPDGNQLAVGERTGLVTLWTLPQPLLLVDQPFVAQELVQTAAGQRLARHFKGHQGAIEVLAFTADGRKLISIGHDNTARCWDVGDQGEARVLEKGRCEIDGLSYSPDGSYLAEASMKGGIRVHDLTSTHPPRSLTARGSRRAVFSPDGRTIAGGPDHGVTLWDAKTGDVLATLAEADPAEHDRANGFSNLGALVFSPDGRWLAAGIGGLFHWPDDEPQKVIVFDVAQRRLHQTFATPTQVSAVAFSADGRLMAAAGHNGSIWLWDTSSWDEIGRWRGPVGTGYGSIVFVPGRQVGEAGRPGDLLATGSKSGRIDLWDIGTRALARQLHGHIGLVSFIAVSPDGRTLATASCDRSIKLWDTGTGRELRTLCREEGWMFALAFSPDGNTLASGGERAVLRFWEASSKETVAADVAALHLRAKTSRPQ